MKQYFTLLSCALLFAPTLGAATFTSLSNGNYNQAARWSVVGSDADGIPDSDDDVILNNAVSLFAAGNCRNITINPGAALVLNTSPMLIYASMVNNGTVAGANSSSVQFRGTGSYTGNPISCHALYFYQNFTIGAGAGTTYCNSVVVSASRTITNNGNILNNGLLSLLAGATWVNANGSTLTTNGISNTGLVNASAATNTVTYSGNYTTIKGTGATYYNLVLQTSPSGGKQLNGALDVDNNLTISTGVTLNCMNNMVTIGGNWINNANTTCTNMLTMSFNGSGTQTITRATSNTETFTNLSVDGTGTVTLGDSLQINGSIDINSGTLDVSTNNYTITVRNSFNDNGTFQARAGLVRMNGTSGTQTISGFATTTFYNLTTNNTNGVSVDFTKRLSNILTVQSGSFGPSGFGAFVMLATGATTYARIAPVLGSLTGSGWRLQSYVNGPATAYWQYLSSPTNNTTINDWDSDPRFYMSGVGGNDGNACCPVFYSVRTYNTSTNTYTNITSTSTTINNGRGYMVWMADNLSALTAPLIYDTRGIPNFGNVTRNVTAGGAGGGYNLVGNPYACPIDYASVVTASGNLNPNFSILMENGQYTTNPNGGVIGPHQGFMAIATSTGAMTFTEACKNITTTPALIRQADPENYLRINVRSAYNGLGGEATVQFRDESVKTFEVNYDMPYLASPYEEAANIFTTSSDQQDLLLNAMNSTEDEVTVPLSVVPGVYGQHTISFKGIAGVNAYNCIWMEDTENGRRIDLNRESSYNFTTQSVGAAHKFMLHFERNSNCRIVNESQPGNLDAVTSVFSNETGVFASFRFDEPTEVRVDMFDMTGRMLMNNVQMTVGTESRALTVPGSHGVYLVRISTDKESVTKKIFY